MALILALASVANRAQGATEPPPLVNLQTPSSELISGQAPVPPGPFSITSSISEFLEYDTNPLMRSTNPFAVLGSITEPQFVLTGLTPDIRIDWTNRLDLNAFDRANYSSIDFHSQIAAKKAWQTGYFKLSSNFDYDTTRTSELATSGVNVAGIRHTGILLTPEVGLDVSQNDTVILSGSFQQANYGNTAVYTDFRFFQFNPAITHAFTPQSVGTVVLQATHFDTLSGVSESADSLGSGLGWRQTFSDRLQANIVVGGEWSRIEAAAVADSSAASSKSITGYFYKFTLAFVGDRDTASLVASRSLLPESASTVVQQTAFRAIGSHRFTPRWSASLSFSYNDNDYSGTPPALVGGLAGRGKSYFQAMAAVSYNLTERLAIAPTYRFRNSTYVASEGDAEGHTFILMLTYTPHAALVDW